MCAMRPADKPTWVGAIVLRNGTTYYGCSVRCTLAISMSPDKFLGVAADQLAAVRVPDYLHPDTLLEADTALYVVDSDVRGPMGLALVPAASEADAAVNVRRHGGKVLRRSEVTLDVLRQFNPRSAR
jgi:nitrous oxide reductase accessory protein NosL